MKKIIALTLVAGMIVALSGCGKTNQGADQTQKQTDAVKTEAEKAETTDKKSI